MMDAVYSASLLAEGTMPAKATGQLPLDKWQNRQSLKPPLG